MDALLNTKDLSAILAKKPATIARNWQKWCAHGFPTPISKPPFNSRLLWRQSDISAYLAQLHIKTINDNHAPPKLKIVNNHQTALDKEIFQDLMNFG